MSGRGRPSSWVSVGIMLAAFAVGGVALTLGAWWLFWTAAAFVVLGGILALVFDVFSDVVLDPIHQQHAEPHVSPIRGTVSTAPRQVEPTLPGHGPDVDATERRQP